MTRSLTIHVAGAGALGLASAVRLAEAGARVTVFDPAPPSANASGVAAGMLAPVFEAVLDEAARPHFALLMAARELWPGFSERYGIDLDRRGAMAVGDQTRLDTLTHAMLALGVRAQRFGVAKAAGFAPGLSPAFAGGLFTAEDWRIEAASALAALRRAAESLGVAFRAERVEGLGEADRLVVATGADPGLAPLAPELARLAPIKGHILRLPRTPYAGVVVRGPAGYAAPAEGGLTIGATMEAGLSDAAVDPVQVERLLAAGREIFPGLAAEAPVRAVTGVRAATPDGLPLAGPSVSPSILLAVGARRNGWLLAPLVAEIVTAHAVGGDPGALAARFDPARPVQSSAGESR